MMLKHKAKTSIDLTKPVLKVNNEPLVRSKEKIAAKTAETKARKYMYCTNNCY